MIFRRLKELERQIAELSLKVKHNKIIIGSYGWLNHVTVKFENVSPNPDPVYATEGDSGFDLRAWLMEDENDVKTDGTGVLTVQIAPHERRLIHTGIRLELPEHTEAQVRPRSGSALKVGLSLANAIGTVYELYRGEVCIIALNTSDKPITIKNGERIAQCVICPVFNSFYVTLENCGVDRNTERGEGGFGHTGTN